MKVLSNILLVFCLMIMFPTNASAYLDPSVATYAIQTTAGIAIAIGAVVGIYWRKAKNKAINKLGIDENIKKEIEEDIIIYDQEIK